MYQTDDITANASSLKEQKSSLTLTSYLSFFYEGCPLFLLLELIPEIPQLDDAKLIRSVYCADVSAVENGWSEWFKTVLRREDNDDLSQIFEAAFRHIPELATRKVRWSEHREHLPIQAIIYEWPQSGYVSLELLDQLKATTDKHTVDFSSCWCANKNEVALWVIRNELYEVDLFHITTAIQNEFPVEVVMAAAEAIVPASTDGCSAVLEEALFSGGQYWNERLLSYLWKNSGFSIKLDIDMPEWFKTMAVKEARTETLISLDWGGSGTDLNLANLLLTEVRRGACLTQLTVTTAQNSTVHVDPIYNVLRQCSTLRTFLFSLQGRGERLLRIPVMENIELLYIGHAILLPESLGPIMNNARQIYLKKCRLCFPDEEESEAVTSVLSPDCLEGWASGLEQNHRIDSLTIIRPRATGSFRVCGRGFARALFSRPNLMAVNLEWHSGGRGFGLDLGTEDMLQFGLMAKLGHLELSSIPPDGLKSLFGARPSNLQEIRVLEDRLTMTHGDYHEFLNYLSHPECRLARISGKGNSRGMNLHLEFRPEAVVVEDGDDWLHLNDPVRSFINVLRDKNSSFTLNGIDLESVARNDGVTLVIGSTKEEEEEIAFWCSMNRTCKNRLRLRQELSCDYVHRIAKYLTRGSHSEAFELIRSTFHLWGQR